MKPSSETRPTTLSEANYDPSRLPGWHPLHMCGMYCDGQDGQNSSCYKEKRKGPPDWYIPALKEPKAAITPPINKVVEAAMAVSAGITKTLGHPAWLTAVGHDAQSVVIFFNQKPPAEILENFLEAANQIPIEWRFMSRPVAV